MNTFVKSLGIPTLVLGGAIGAAAFAQAPAQTSSTDQTAAPAATQSTDATASQNNANPNDSGTYATGKPLQGQSKEGFWGHMNPFARKKWVQRSIDPIRDRTNELDQLQAKNARDIKDVDSRAQAGINKAMMAANTADQHAADAANRANQAQSTATGAQSRAETLNGTVNNLDQYQQVTQVDVKFPKGRTTLGQQGKQDLDQLADKLSSEKGYIIEIQGFSRGGVQSSQAMADSVARYLVTEKQVPLYRIYRSGLGRIKTEKGEQAQATNNQGQTASTQANNEAAPLPNGVRVTLLHNSLASMGSEPSNPATQQQQQYQQNQTAPATSAAPSNQGAPSSTPQ